MELGKRAGERWCFAFPNSFGISKCQVQIVELPWPSPHAAWRENGELSWPKILWPDPDTSRLISVFAAVEQACPDQAAENGGFELSALPPHTQSADVEHSRFPEA